jgi:putative inorganic carbon (HCO3(-)) transporter
LIRTLSASQRKVSLTQVFGGLALAVAGVLIALLPIRDLLLVVAVAAIILLLIRHAWLIWPIIGGLLPFAAAMRIGPASALDALLLVAAALWFADGVRRRSLRFAPSIILPPAFAYWVLLGLASLGATNLDEALREMIKWLQFVVVLLIAPPMLSQNSTPSRAQWVVAALLAAAAAQAILGLYQFVFRIGPEWFILFDRYMRASGTFGQPNPYAGYLGLTFPVAISLVLFALHAVAAQRSRALNTTLVGVASTIVATVIGAGMLASWSRGAWVGALAAALVVVFGRSRRWIALGVGVAALAVTSAMLGAIVPNILPESVAVRVRDLPAYIGLGNVLQQPLTDDNFAVVERVAHWVAAIRMWERSLWLGVGPGNYATLYESVRLPLWEEPLGHAHNIYLNTLAESGLLGLIGLLLLWGTVVGQTISALKKRRGANRGQIDWTAAVGFGLLGVLTHLAVHSIFDSLFVQGMIVHLALWVVALSALTSTHASVAVGDSTQIGIRSR